MLIKSQLLFISTLILVTALTINAQKSSEQDLSQIPARVNAALYNLPSHKFVSFSSKITPDWVTILAGASTNPEGMKILNGIHFKVVHDIHGQTKLEHFEDIPMTTQAQKDGLVQIFSGLDQMLRGFYATWDLFTISAPIVTNGSAVVTADGSGYLIEWKEGSSDVAVKVGSDMTATRVTVKSPEFSSVVIPTFTRSSQGLLLSGYKGSYISKDASENTELNVVIDYHDVSGVKLIKHLSADGTYGGSSIKSAMDFSDEQVTFKKSQ